MIVGSVLCMSLLLQLIAVALSIRLVRITDRRWAWTLITLAITLMAFRRGITLFHLLSGDREIPPDLAVEVVSLIISTFMVVGIVLIARSHLILAPPESELKEEPLLRRMTQTALGLAVVAVMGSSAIVLLTYQVSYQSMLKGITQSLSNVTKHFTQLIENDIPHHSRAEVLDNLDSFWEAYDTEYEVSYLCVIDSDQRLLLHTRHPEMIGRYIGEMSIQLNTTNETATFQSLITNKQTGTGTFFAQDGEKQILTFAYAPTIDVLFAVHTPYEVVRNKTLATALPLSIGAGVMALILFPLAISMLLWSYKTAQRTSSRRQAILQQTEARYQALTSVTSVGIFHTDPEGKCLYVNDRWCELTGLTPQQALGDGWSKAMHPEDRERIAEQWQHAITGKLPFSSKYRYQRADGSVKWIFGQAIPEFNASGSLIGYLGTTTDITEVKLAEQRFRSMLESAPDAMFVVNTSGEIVLVNARVKVLFGYESEELLGQQIELLIPHRFHDRHVKYRSDYFDNSEARAMGAALDLRGLRKDGSEFPIDSSLSPIETESGMMVIAAVRDVTERKLIQRRQQLLMAELDHRVKNNLSAVIALAEQTIATAPSLASFRESYVGRIRALARTHESLAATKWTGAKLSEILRLTLDPFSRENSPRISTRGDDIMLDARTCQPITMALHELATNAAKYGSLSTPEGSISIEWRLDPEHQLHFSWIESGGPPITEPPQIGFGSSLIRGVIEHELAGTVEIEYLRDGLSCTMTIPMECQPPHPDLSNPEITSNVKEQVFP